MRFEHYEGRLRSGQPSLVRRCLCWRFAIMVKGVGTQLPLHATLLRQRCFVSHESANITVCFMCHENA
ncbi:hypothetical protein AB1N83_005126 [Pleurotus pulmonarius]